MKFSSLIRPFRSAGLTLAVGTLVASASLAMADQTYTIKLHVAPGDKWNFDVTSSMSQKGQVLANGQLAQPIDQGYTQHRKGTLQVLEVEDGAPSAIRVVYDADSSNTGQAGAQQPPPFKLAGKTVNISRKNGIVTTDLGNDIDTDTVKEVGHMLDPDKSIYPKAPVAINQEWEGDTTAAAQEYQLGPKDKIEMKCKLLQVHEVGGRQVAEISVNGTMLKHDEGFIETKINVDGASRIDLQTGQPIDSNLDGKVSTSGQQQQQGNDGQPVTIAVSATGEIKVHQHVEPVITKTAEAGNPNIGFNPVPAPAPTPAPAPAPATGNNADAGVFTGSFKGDQVALDLTDNAGTVSGTLTVGDKKFPLTGLSKGNELTGSFESEGTKFQFAAALDGSNLTLTSEGNTYKLKKPSANPLARPKNPLGNQPAPKNPLGE